MVCSFLYTEVSSDDVAGVVSLFVCCVVCTGPRRAAWLKNALDVSHVSSYMTKYSVSAGQGIPTHHRNNRYTMRARSRIVSLLFAKSILDLSRSATNPKRPKTSSHRRVHEPKRSSKSAILLRQKFQREKIEIHVYCFYGVFYLSVVHGLTYFATTRKDFGQRNHFLTLLPAKEIYSASQVIVESFQLLFDLSLRAQKNNYLNFSEPNCFASCGEIREENGLCLAFGRF